MVADRIVKYIQNGLDTVNVRRSDHIFLKKVTH